MTSEPLSVRLIGGPTALITIGAVRFLTDPTFDPPGDYPMGHRTLVKTRGPAVQPAEIGPLAAVLLSHDQHPDNLDHAGRAFLDDVPVVLTTPMAHQRLAGNTRSLPTWQSTRIGSVDVMAVPAQHGPDGTEHLTGPVTGFVLSGTGLPTVYVSGDNASLDVVRDIAARVGPVDVALLFAGAARSPAVAGNLTLGSSAAAEAALILGAGRVIPVHTQGWAHFSEGPETLASAFELLGVADRLVLLEPGATFDLTSQKG